MPSSPATPEPTRVYQNHHLDSTRWEVFEPREGDVVVTTSYKSGTTWTQQILLVLLRGSAESMRDVMKISPWIDARFHGSSKAELAQALRDLPDRRFVKSHLPLDGLPWYPQVKYLVVGRDPRDVFMSLLNHYGSYTETAYAALNETPDRVGDPLPPCPDDPRELWRSWITRGWFDWESEGYPFWSNMHHSQTYWEYRHLPNLLFLHYADMLADLEGQVRRVARFLEIDAGDELIARCVEATTFSNVKKSVEKAAAEKAEDDAPEFFRGGARTFFFKGSNGRWRDLLDADDLALYRQARERVLAPDCAEWLERGSGA